MSSTEHEADVPTGTTPPEDGELGGLTVEDDPQGTVNPADLAGTASDDDEDVS